MRTIGAISIAATLLITAIGSSQFRSVGSPGTGQPSGGGTGGGKGGFGFGMTRDPAAVFDFYARGRPYISISETRGSTRDGLMAYAKDKGITNDQVTREQFMAYWAKQDQYRPAGGGFGGGGFGMQKQGAPGTPTPAPGAPSTPAIATVPAGQNPLDAISQWAEADFRRRDLNGDGKLTPEEMSEQLRAQIDRWDTDHDGLISLDEYKVYYSARLQMRDGAPTSPSANPITILIEEDYDRRPDVIRVGKLPKELPKWFAELDTDHDGQVALHEWVKGSKAVDEFREWDRNDDGLITAEEVLFKNRANKTATASASPSSGTQAPASSGGGSRFGSGEGGGRPSFGGSGGGGFGKGGGFFKKREQ